MDNIPKPRVNGTRASGWPADMIGESYEGPLEVEAARSLYEGDAADERSSPPSSTSNRYQRQQSAQNRQKVQTPPKKESARSVNSERSVNSVSSGSSVSDKPLTEQQRKAVFRLVRQLKKAHPDYLLDDAELRHHWENDHGLRRVPWDRFRYLFLSGWKLAYPPGQNPLAQDLAEADKRPLPAVAARYEDPRLQRLVRLCARLQERAGAEPFFLAGTGVADEFGVGQTTAAWWLRLLVSDEVLVIVKKGYTGKATEYWFNG